MRNPALRTALIVLAAWAGLGAVAQAAEPCRRETFERAPFTVCAFDALHQDLRLASAGADGVPLRSFDALAKALGPHARVRFAMNAGMFDDDGNAIGLLIEDGVQRHGLSTADGPGNFHMKPNGVFSQGPDGTLRAETSEHFAARGGAPKWATQSGPMLVIDGKLHPQIADDGPSHYIRNGVGVRDPHTALFVISGAPVSFGKLARFFRDRLKCRNALYFDGSVSSLWAPALGREDDGHDLGPMVVVLDRR